MRAQYKLPVLTAGPRQPWIPWKGLGDAAPTRTGQAAPKKGPQLASFRDWRGARLAGDKLSKLGKGAGLSMPLGQRGLECQRAGPAAGWGPGAKARRFPGHQASQATCGPACGRTEAALQWEAECQSSLRQYQAPQSNSSSTTKLSALPGW